MEALEYIKLFRMDQPNFNFNREKFLETLGNEFRDYIKGPNFGVDPLTGKIPYFRFKEAVKNFETKFQSISQLKRGNLSPGLWRAFFALYVVPIRAELFPEIQNKIVEIKTKRDKNNLKCPRRQDKIKHG